MSRTRSIRHRQVRMKVLEVVPRVLAENSGQKATQVIAALYSAHAKGQKAAGVDIKNKGVLENAHKAGISDLYYTKNLHLILPWKLR